MEYKISPQELQYRSSLPLLDKIEMSCEKIEQWYDYFDGMVYVSFSGGRDSTVLLDLVRNRAFIPDAINVPAVFSDTGLEYPEIRDFVKTFENVVWIKPTMNFRQVIEKYGYPIISKEQSANVYNVRNSKSDKLINKIMYGENGVSKISKRWKYLLNAPFKISHKCCDKLKKQPFERYATKSKRRPMTGSRTEESLLRKMAYFKNGCNLYDGHRQISNPMAFWTKKDIFEYIEKYNLPYSKIYNMGYDRTGCMFCAFGVQFDESPNRFQKMKITHPKLYEYCINNMGMGDVLEYIDIEY
jgi:3'-phosphoadenosine 5'-phosphosulfate sulfotransferase (PAPS reductase)/FAD synthetase